VVARVDADYVRTTAEVAAERILCTHPRLSGFFAANDLIALGVADALRSAGKTADVKIIGLDGIAEALDALRSGSINATVSQYPYVLAIPICNEADGGRGVRRGGPWRQAAVKSRRSNRSGDQLQRHTRDRAFPPPLPRLLGPLGAHPPQPALVP
jgi:ribose transport system substrate-binding protein